MTAMNPRQVEYVRQALQQVPLAMLIVEFAHKNCFDDGLTLEESAALRPILCGAFSAICEARGGHDDDASEESFALAAGAALVGKGKVIDADGVIFLAFALPRIAAELARVTARPSRRAGRAGKRVRAARRGTRVAKVVTRAAVAK